MRVGHLIVALLVLLSAGCVQFGGSPPPVDADFSPTRIYTQNVDVLWNAMIKVFQSKGIAIGNADRKLGQIQTDYVVLPGTGGEVHLGGGTEYQGRAKYKIFLDAKIPGKISVTIVPTIEVMTTYWTEGKGFTFKPWHDATVANPGWAQRLALGAFTEFENLLPSDGSHMPSDQRK